MLEIGGGILLAAIGVYIFKTNKMKVYRDYNDWWIGYYRGENFHFVCPLPTVVFRWPR